jgi:hyperosmotically inducible periplasmic protein
MVKLIVSALIACGALAQTGCAVTSGQSTMGQYVDDSTITARVKKRFAEDPQVAATRINVETMKGTVQLSGFAASETERARAVQIARSVPDVVNVRNDVIVRAASQ